MTELFFIAFPIATIIFAIALQKIFKSPILVAAIIFAIFLIVTFAVFDSTFLINTIIYTILAFITAFLVCLICRTNIKNISCNEDLSIASGINNVAEIANTSNNNGCCNCNRNFSMVRCNRIFK